jgi:hypothetical protein
MRLEELQQQWQRLDQKLDQSLALQTELIRRVVMQPVRRRVNRLAIWPAMIDVVFCVGLLLLGAAFLSDHWRNWHHLAPASVVMIGATALLVSSIRQLERAAALDWCGPVAEIQSSLERLRVAKIRQFKWIMLLAPLVGFCGLMVGLHWGLERLSDDRVNILDKLDSWWIVANYAFGMLFVPLGYLVARTLAKRCHGHRWWQAVVDGIAGNSLKAATLDLDRWASLQQEAPSHSD